MRNDSESRQSTHYIPQRRAASPLFQPSDAPLVRGGQGREPEHLTPLGWFNLGIMVATVAIVALLLIGAK